MPTLINLYSYIYTRLHWFWLGIAAPVGFAMVFLTPPFQVPDEFAHFIRAAQVSIGVFHGKRDENGNPGGDTPRSAVSLYRVEGFHALRFHPEQKTDIVNATESRLYSIEWDGREQFFANLNTILYPPTSFILPAIGLKLGQWFKLKVLPSFYLARLLNCIGCILMAFFGIRLMAHCKWFVAIVLGMPMALFEFASISHDALLFGSAALGAGLLSRLLSSTGARGRDWRIMGAVFFLFFLLCAGRPPYAPILLVATLLIALNKKQLAKPALLIGFISIMGVIAWLAAVSPLIVSLGEGLDPRQQMSNITEAPLQFVYILVTACLDKFAYLRLFVGVLGWLDITLPTTSYFVYNILLGITIVCGISLFLTDSKCSRLNFTIVILGCFAALSLIMIAQYLTFTKVGAQLVNGIQGRYFIPIACFAALAMKDGTFTAPFWKCLSSFYGVFAVVSICLVDVGVLFSIVERYYY